VLQRRQPLAALRLAAGAAAEVADRPGRPLRAVGGQRRRLPGRAEVGRGEQAQVGGREEVRAVGRVELEIAHGARRVGLAADGGHLRLWVAPGRAAVGRQRDAARLQVGVERVAEAIGQHVRVRGVHRQRAGAQGAEPVGERHPGDAAVPRLPDAAAGRGDVDDVRVRRVRHDGAEPSGVDQAGPVLRDVGIVRPDVDPRVARHGSAGGGRGQRATQWLQAWRPQGPLRRQRLRAAHAVALAPRDAQVVQQRGVARVVALAELRPGAVAARRIVQLGPFGLRARGRSCAALAHFTLFAALVELAPPLRLPRALAPRGKGREEQGAQGNDGQMTASGEVHVAPLLLLDAGEGAVKLVDQVAAAGPE
jgi:hypothetical protein